jgi:hypothetical protein
LFRLEFADVQFRVGTANDGRLIIKPDSTTIPSLPDVQYRFALAPGNDTRRSGRLRAMLEKHVAAFFAGLLDRIDKAEFQQYLAEVYDSIGYYDPDRPMGPGDALNGDGETN